MLNAILGKDFTFSKSTALREVYQEAVMSKFDEFDMDELDQLTEEALGEQMDAEFDAGANGSTIVQGPTPSIASTKASTEEVVQRYSHCDLCGGRLHFNYVSDFSRNTTHEKASCPECGLETRQVLHRLQ